MKKANSKEYELPTDMAYDHPELYIYNFKRSIMEFEALIKRIEKPDPRDCGFFENYFAENLEITLFGFSMGGLRALSCFLRNPDKYHSCITFNSGVNLTKINTTELNLDARSWEDTFTRVESLVENPRFLQNQRENKEILDLFRWLHLGRNQTYLKKRLQDHSYRYLSIQSGADTIFEANNPMGEYVDEHGHGLNRLIIAGVGHVPTMDLKWDNWMSKVGENIVRFIQRCKETYWAHADLEKEIAELIKETQFLKDIKEAAKEDERYFKNFDFSFAVFKELKKQIKSNEKDPKRFEELYYISKAFYPKFSELLEKIAGHRKK
jgi:hypothetical protein